VTGHFRYFLHDGHPSGTDYEYCSLKWQRRGAQALIIIAIIGGVAILHAATGVVAPMLLSLLCALLLAPLVKWLTRIGIPRLCAATLVLALLIVAFGLVLNATWQPARAWLASAPHTMTIIERKIRPVQSVFVELDHVGREAQRFAGAANPPQASAAPVPLPMAAITIVPSAVMTLVTGLALVFLLLVIGPLWLERIKKSVGANRQRRVVLLIETVRTELSRYLVTIAAIGVVLGTLTMLLVRAFGVPNALLWGTMAGVFSLVPYLGSLATLIVLTVVGLVTFDRLPPVLEMSGLFLMLQILEGQFIQPFLVGRRLELNPVIVVLAIWFFGALWGLAGVILAVPLLVTLKATASHIEALHVILPLVGSLSTPAATTMSDFATPEHAQSWWQHSVLEHAVRDIDEVTN
jgi:predicted PurR-regulated permease PerM